MTKRSARYQAESNDSGGVPAGVIAAQVIGMPRITANGSELQLRYRKSEALLYYLATENRSASRSFVTQLLWPELDSRAGARNLRGVLTDLRSVLGPRLQADPASGSISVLQIRCDRRQLDPKRADRSEAVTTDAAELLLGHESLLEGFSLPDADPFETWKTDANIRFQDERHAMRFAAVDVALRNDQTDLAISLLEACLIYEPWNEAVAQRLAMLHLLWKSPPRAVSVLDDMTRALRRELNEAPHAATRHLRDQATGIAARAIERSPTLQGRHREIELLRGALLEPTTQILTLCASPGMGASRVLIEAESSAQLLGKPDVMWIDGSASEDAETLAARIDAAIEQRTVESQGSTSRGQLRVILDGVAGHPDLREIVERVASRSTVELVLVHAWRPLGLEQERVLELSGLATPGISGAGSRGLATPAARLLADAYRAHRTTSSEGDISQHPEFTDWVRSTEGHPITILATARYLAGVGIGTTSPFEPNLNLPSLDVQRMQPFLAPLSAEYLRVMKALSLHRHAVTAEALAQTLGEDTDTVAAHLGELLNSGVVHRAGEARNLFQAAPGVAPTFRQAHQTDPEWFAWLQQHAADWISYLEPLGAPELGMAERELMARAIDQLDDIDVAIAFLSRETPVSAIRLCTLASSLNRTISRPDKVIRSLAPLLEQFGPDLEPAHRIDARNALAMAHAFSRQTDKADPLQQAALLEAEEIEDAFRRTQSKLNLGYVRVLQGNFEGAAKLFREAGDDARQAELRWLLGGSQINLGHALKDLHQYEEAVEAYTQGIQAMHQSGDGLSEAGGSIGLISALAALEDTDALATTIHALNVKLGRLPKATAQVLTPSLERNLYTLAHLGLNTAFEHLARVARQNGLTLD